MIANKANKTARNARLLLLGLFASACVSLLAACHTVEGAGKDIESAGEGIQDAAD